MARKDDGSKEEARRIVVRSLHCICDHMSDLVHAAPVKVQIDVDGPTQKARKVTLIWSTGDTTTQGPIADCFRAQLARETFAFGLEQDSVVTYPLNHLTCGPSE